MTPRQNAINRKVARDRRPIPRCTDAFFIKGTCVACRRTLRNHFGAKEHQS